MVLPWFWWKDAPSRWKSSTRRSTNWAATTRIMTRTKTARMLVQSHLPAPRPCITSMERWRRSSVSFATVRGATSSFSFRVSATSAKLAMCWRAGGSGDVKSCRCLDGSPTRSSSAFFPRLSGVRSYSRRTSRRPRSRSRASVSSSIRGWRDSVATHRKPAPAGCRSSRYRSRVPINAKAAAVAWPPACAFGCIQKRISWSGRVSRSRKFSERIWRTSSCA